MPRFAGLNTQVLGISVDSVPCLTAWAESLGGIHYPLLSDFWPHGEVARRFGVLIDTQGITERALFIIDPEGIIRYIDIHDISRQPSNDALVAEISKFTPHALPLEEDRDLPAGGVVMYCTPWCSDCRDARAWLKEKGIAYTEVDISRSAKARAQVREWAGGNETTPTFEIDGVVVVDFDRPALEKVLKLV